MLFVPLYVVTGAWDAGFGIQGWHTLAAESAPGARAVARRLAGRHLGACPDSGAVGSADRWRGFAPVEAEIEEDAATCATPLQAIWHITLRRVAPAIVMASIWVAIVAAVEISVTDFFQVRTFAEEVYTQAALGTFGLIDAAKRDGLLTLSCLAAGLWIGLFLSTMLAFAAMLAAGRLFSQRADAPHQDPWIWQLGAGVGPRRLSCGPSCCWWPVCRSQTSFTKRASS